MKLYINAVNYPDTALFSPQRPITRAEVVGILSQTLHEGTNTIEFSYSIIIPSCVKIQKIQDESKI